MRVSLCLLALFLTGATVGAQAPTTTTAPADYGLLGYVDYPREDQVLRRSEFYVMGWMFECRSGLQPFTQRIGDITIGFFAPGQGNKLPGRLEVFGGWERPDVAAAFSGACPSVGKFVGYGLGVTGLPPAGTWTLTVSWITWDGAGRPRQHTESRTITLID